MKNLIHKIILIIIIFGTSLQAGSETVSQKEAQRLATTFFNTLYDAVSPTPKLAWNGRELTTDKLFSPFYVFNSPRGGFVVISAENKAFPILAYSKGVKFDKSSLNKREYAQFQRFAREIELIRYDARNVDRAVYSWQHIPEYFTQIISSPYDSEEFLRLTDDAKDEIEEMDRRNGWIIMPTAVEYDIYNPEQYRDYTLDDVLVDEDDQYYQIPYKFYEDFLQDIDNETRAKAAAYDEILYPSHPKVRSEGGGTYTIFLPEPAKLMRVYDVTGRRMIEKTYGDTNSAFIDMSGLGAGYYIIMIITDNGKIYGFKLAR